MATTGRHALDTFGFGEGMEQILTGAIVILVIVLASFREVPD